MSTNTAEYEEEKRRIEKDELLCVRARWTEQEIQMIKDHWWWTPDLAAYYIPEQTGIHRSVKSFARKQKQILGKIPTNDYVDD